MEDKQVLIRDASETDPNLLCMLDRGIEDIEAGRTAPHNEAIEEVRKIRAARRAARSGTEVIINA